METTFLQNVREWLTAHQKDRAWLGEQVGVSKRTVDNWFAAGVVPTAKRELVEKVIEPRPGLRATVNCNIRFSVEEWLAVSEALPPGTDVEEVVRQYLLGKAVRKAERYIETHDPRPEGKLLEAEEDQPEG